MYFSVFSQKRGIYRNLDHSQRRKIQVKNFQTINDNIFLFTLFPCRSNLPQVKQNLRPNILNFSYELPKTTQDLGSQEIKRVFKH